MAKVIIDRERLEKVQWREMSPTATSTLRRRLLITTDNFLPRWDGISRFLSEIIPRLRESYDITVVAPDYGQVTIEGVEIIKIPLGKKSWGDYTPARFAYRKIKNLVRRHDIVFNQGLGPIGICAILAAKRCRRPLASYIHSIEWELFPKSFAGTLGPFRGTLLPFSKTFVAYFYNRCSVLIMPSENIVEIFSWQRISTPKKVAHLGVDTEKFLPGDKMSARTALKLPPSAFIIGYHGRIGHEKNLPVLLRAFRRVKIPGKRLLIVGDGVSSIKRKLLRSDDVIVTGSRNDVANWLHTMDIYIQPSLTETTSLTVLEAMACELPVISSKVGFIKHYINDGKNGMFFDNTNTYDLATKIMRLYKDAPLRATLAKEARKTVVDQFNWQKTATDIKAILDNI